MTTVPGGGGSEDRLVGSERVLAVLVELAGHPSGASLEELTRAVASPKATVHRALASLRRAGFANQDGRGRYVLGDNFLRLAFAHHEARPDHVRVQHLLERLCNRFGETAHYAVLDGRDIVYRAKANPATGAIHLSSTVGGRNPAHCTAVGKLLLGLALSDDAAVRAWAETGPLERKTPRTKVATEDFCAELAQARSHGYAVEDEENEPGVACLAVPVYLGSPTVPTGAISVSALSHRTPLSTLVKDLDAIRAIVSGQE